MARAMKVNTVLITLEMENNKFGNDGMEAFEEVRKTNKVLKNLRLEEDEDPTDDDDMTDNHEPEPGNKEGDM